MPKRPRMMLDPGKRWSEGVGQGIGSTYRPWITIQSFASRGLSGRIKGWKTNRTHHLVSKLEMQYFYLLEWSIKVTDIREQYPLWPLDGTTEIAKHIGVRPPAIPSTKELSVLTTDFVITVSDGNQSWDIARTVKYAKDLENIRTIEKLEIERLWWEARGVDWGIVTENEIPKVLVKNVELLHGSHSLEGHPDLQRNTEELIEYVTKAVQNDLRPLSRVASECDRALNLGTGSTLTLVKHLIATRRWVFDMNLEFVATQPLKLFNTDMESR
jgi:hypothetical protein